MHYKELDNRFQFSMFNTLEDLVSEHNVVRLIDALLNQLSRREPEHFHNTKGQHNIGCKAYSPIMLSKLFLYGYLNRIASSRRLESETHRNIELMWLLENGRPDHKTISDFRKDNSALIRHITTSFRKFLKDNEFIEGNIVATDGSKIKAYNRRDMITMKGVNNRLSHLDKELENYLSQLDRNDIVETTEEQIDDIQAERVVLEEELSMLRVDIAKLNDYKAKMQSLGQNSYCKNDPEARQMKSRDGFIPAYNVQSVIDDKHKMITSAEVITSASDIHALQDNIEATKEQLGKQPEAVIADYGYGNTEQMEKVEESGTKCYIPLPDNPNTEKDKKNGVSFTYNKEEDTVSCSQGQTLFPMQKVNKSNQNFNVYRTKKGVCQQCTLWGKCTKSKNGRIFHVGERYEYKQKCLHNQETEAFKEIYKKRKGMVEHPFGTLKLWMGKIPLLLTTRKKVQTEIDLYTTAYNLKRLINIRPIKELLQIVAQYEEKKLLLCSKIDK